MNTSRIRLLRQVSGVRSLSELHVHLSGNVITSLGYEDLRRRQQTWLDSWCHVIFSSSEKVGVDFDMVTTVTNAAIAAIGLHRQRTADVDRVTTAQDQGKGHGIGSTWTLSICNVNSLDTRTGQMTVSWDTRKSVYTVTKEKLHFSLSVRSLWWVHTHELLYFSLKISLRFFCLAQLQAVVNSHITLSTRVGHTSD